MSATDVVAPVIAAPRHLDLARLNAGGLTQWANLGDWSHANSYPAAAQALARRLGRAVGLAAGQRVADIGVGGGESVLEWIETFDVAQVTAVDRSHTMIAAAARRLNERRHGTHVTLATADASVWTMPHQSLDRVVVLDGAYHFADRPGFWRRAATWLCPGGRIGVTDLVVTRAPSLALRMIARLMGIPTANLVTESQYRAALTQAGFTNVHTEDLTASVLVGFTAWARSQPMWSTRLTGRLADALVRRDAVRYLLVTADVAA